MGIFGSFQRLADFLTVVISFSLGYWIYLSRDAHSVPYRYLEFLGIGIFAGILFISVFQSVRLYERTVSLLNIVESRRLLIGWFLGSLVLLSVTFYFRFFDLSRIMVSISLGILFILLFFERSILYQWQVLSGFSPGNRRHALIYGAGVVGRHLYKRIYHSPALGLTVCGFLDDDEKLWGQTIRMGEIRRKNGNIVLGGLSQIEQIQKNKDVKEVFVALPNATYQRNFEIVQVCRKLGISVSVVPPTYGHHMHALEIEDIGGIPVVKEKSHKPSFFYPFLKRVVDISISLFALTILSPIYFLIACLVKLDSDGPIIFKQKRVGLNGKEFDFYKFRTMKANANPYEVTPKTAADPRLTKFGRWLRRSSLDELPQFISVLRGEMSIVGPRPEMPFIVAQYNEEQKERLRVKPGITGVWQISAVRGEPIHANIEYDLFYLEHRSVLLDVIIMIKTILTAIRGIGAV
ncbi:MAG: exopolysaccharide biosynthesis polyprenyl glycosylphosphotransferase [Oligoflexia bacterium]|nr:exopolysaccharide biosynthesis polyprenyl glycosylphosphotransferase [Oligoflexia bacterium]